MFDFKILKDSKESRARFGIIETPHGLIETPAFVPVATKGALRGISFEKAVDYGARVFIINTYHLFQNDRYKIIQKFGGLHKYLNINYPLMTDSGGFQVFSLGFGVEEGVGKIANIFPAEYKGSNPKKKKKSRNWVKIDDEGVNFIQPLNGKKLRLSPKLSVKIQEALGADFIFAFDECTSPFNDYDYVKKSLTRTHRWAIRCLEVFKNKNQAMFGIVQGGEYRDLREESVKFIGKLPFFGIGIGGSLGQSKKDMHKILDWLYPFLPFQKPRHLLGIGEIDDLFEGVSRGIDVFDCVVPTRWARHGAALTFGGRINLTNVKYLKDKGPIDKKCGCGVCLNHSRAYISHLLKEKEIFGIMLLTEHNLAWVLNLMEKIRKSIREDKFLNLRKKLKLSPVFKN